MADDKEGTNDVEDGGVADYDGNDANDGNDITDTVDLIGTTTTPASFGDDGANSVVEDYPDDDEVLPDVTVNLIINDGGDGALTDIVNAAITDQYGNVITTPWSDVIDGYTGAITQGIHDELSGNGTDIGGKRWWGAWSWHKALVVGLIALCIIGIILAVIFMIIGRRKKNTASTQPSSSAKGKKKGVTTQDPQYSAVPTNV